MAVICGKEQNYCRISISKDDGSDDRGVEDTWIEEAKRIVTPVFIIIIDTVYALHYNGFKSTFYVFDTRN